jgi:gas vesicle protein
MENIHQRPHYFLSRFVMGILLGGVIGAVVALWLVSQSGKQTQTRIRQQGETLKRQADKRASRVYEQIEETATEAVDQVERLRHKGEQLLDDQVESISLATASVKDAISA